MFEGCLQLCLEFIGAQAPCDGCSSAQLSEFICEDVLPYQGWASNEVLRDTIVRLLLTTHESEFDVYAGAARNELATSCAQRASATASAPGGRVGDSVKTTASAPVIPYRDPQRRRVSAQEAIVLLDSGRLAWTESIEDMECSIAGLSRPQPPPPPGRWEDRSSSLYFTPSHALRERVMGFPIRNEKLEMVSRFITENAVLGWDRLPSTPEFKARYKNHLVSSGLKWLHRVHKVTLAYMYHEPSREVVYRFFPHFAIPLTEREKKEDLTCEEAEEEESGSGAKVSSSRNSRATPSSGEGEPLYGEWGVHSSGGSGGGIGAAASVAFASSSLQQRRACRRHYPLHHYYARKRRQEAAFPGVAFDLELVRQLVQQSPDRRLLMQDAVHAILAAHNLFLTRWEDFSRAERMHLRRLMSVAGLRIVTASVSLRGHLRELRLVIPSEDLSRQLCAASVSASSCGPMRSQARVGAEGGDGEDGNGRHSLCYPNSSDGVDDNAEDHRIGDNTGSGGETASRRQHVAAPVILRPDPEPGRDGASEELEFDDDDDGGGGMDFRDSADDDDGSGQGHNAQSQAAASSPPHSSTRRQQLEAVAVLRVEANHALELQAAQEAERRPLSLTAAVPHFRFHMPYKQRSKVLGAFLDRYAKLHGTLVTQYLLLPRTKVLTLVYAPRPLTGPPAQGSGAVEARAAAVVEKGDQGDAHALGEGVEVAAALDTAAAAAGSPLPLSRTLHFEPSDPRLPKGLSAYSVNTVLDVLVQASPHHAASVPRLMQSIDVSTLNRRVLPFLRHLEYVYTTAVTQRGRKHVGLVVLVPTEGERRLSTLSDAEKQSVLEAEAAAELTGRNTRQPVTTSAVSGKSIPSGMVLQRLPAVLEGARRSTLGERLVEMHPAATKVVNRVMAVRNGYARSLVQRTSRLHLELWHQHYRYPTRDAAPSAAAGAGSVCVREMYARMTLSTFVVVVGLPQADLGFVLGRVDGVCGWSTPLRDLPPSVYGWCLQRGSQMLLACLQELHARQLIRLSQSGLNSFFSPEACDVVTYTLEPQCSVDGYTHHFMSAPPTAAASLYACMRYWLPFWSAIGRPSHRLESTLLALQSNATVAQVVALSKVLRQDPSVLGAQLYQSSGLPLESRRSVRLGAVGNVAAMHGSDMRGAPGRDGTSFSASLFARPPHWRDRDAGGISTRAPVAYGGRHVALQRPRKAPRTEISGRTVAEALESAFHHFSPFKRVEEVVRLVLRGRSLHLSHHPLFCVPATLPAMLTGRRRGLETNSALLHSLNGVAMALPTEFNMMGTGQGGGAYNRLVSASTLHMATLAETLRAVRNSNAVHGAQNLQRSSSTEVLSEEVERVYAPQAAAFPTGTATTGCEPAQPCVAMPSLSLSSALLTPSTQAPETRSPPSAKLSMSLLQVEAGFEVVTDILRMILFSDQAHYRASVARSLLTALNRPSMVSHARTFLQRLPAFRRTRQQSIRVPQISLAQSPYILPISALRTTPRPCANLAVLHQWAQEVDAVGGAVAGGRESSTMLWARAEMNSLLALNAQAPLQRTPPLPLELLYQPLMDPADMSMASNVVRQKMTQLPLPQLAWPPEAVACEGLLRRRRSERAGKVDETGMVVETAAARRTRKRLKRKRFSAARGGGDASSEEEEEEDSVDEKSDDDADSVAVTRAQAETARRLYPARSIRNCGDPPYLQDLPIDGPPTAVEQCAVEACREALSSSAFASLSPSSSRRSGSWSPDGSGLMPYPSIFHHVDGSWHSYMWHLVVHTVYRYILRVPGICHADLEARLLASGVLSQRALWVVLQFLVDHQLLLCHEEELVQPLGIPGGDVLGGPPRLRSPFQRRKRLRPDATASLPSFIPAPTGESDSSPREEENDVRLDSIRRNCCYHPTLPLDRLRLVMSPGLLDPLLA
ncbi:hypothetical protein JKF63_06217 [Porcisia hertigi]|uniref:Uncharacterized protein n=1 Tax=Porcisia hertigi TaxID=2761500 RepID=A0A836LG82_9TRYP|nr:hypothetical protein JKF63_06217 [Porcisia hertigi]